METEQSCGTHKCEEHSKVDFIVKALTARLDNIDLALIVLGKLSERVALLITLVGVSGSIVVAGCIYTFTALPNFKEVYSAHILETQKQFFTMRSENNTLSSDLHGKINAISERISNLEDKPHDYGYDEQSRKQSKRKDGTLSY